VDPAGHADPALQLPVQAAVPNPADEPNAPSGHWVQDPAPAPLYCPAGQMDAVALVLPAGQAYPAVHGPLHVATVRPTLAPYLPAAHGPLQPAVGSAAVPP
jgi:hypothetical protein